MRRFFLWNLTIMLGALQVAYGAPHLQLRPAGSQRATPKIATEDVIASYLEMSSQRQSIIAENLANSNTPGYQAKEVMMPEKLGDITAKGQKKRRIFLRATSHKHLRGRHKYGGEKVEVVKEKNPWEIKPNGNNVSLAQQTGKMNENSRNYQTALKSHSAISNLLNAALGK